MTVSLQRLEARYGHRGHIAPLLVGAVIAAFTIAGAGLGVGAAVGVGAWIRHHRARRAAA